MHIVGTWESMFLKRKTWDEGKRTPPVILMEIQSQKLSVQIIRLLSNTAITHVLGEDKAGGKVSFQRWAEDLGREVHMREEHSILAACD